MALLWAAALGMMAPAAAADHPKGKLVFSVGGSAAYSSNEEIRRQDASQVVFDDYTVDLPATEDRDSYTDIDLSLFLSSGYFFIDRLEVGILASTILTQYSSTDREDFSLYDGKLYGKYFFDNASSLTPFVKLQWGQSWVKSGDYQEANRIGGAVAGLEYYGLGPWSYFAELSSEYTSLGGDRGGYEWKNQIYLGISLYLDLKKQEREAAETAAALAPSPVDNLSPEIRRWIQAADKQWGDDVKRVDEKLKNDD